MRRPFALIAFCLSALLRKPGAVLKPQSTHSQLSEDQSRIATVSLIWSFIFPSLPKLAQEALVFKWQDTGEAHEAILYQAAAPCSLPLVGPGSSLPLHPLNIDPLKK